MARMERGSKAGAARWTAAAFGLVLAIGCSGTGASQGSEANGGADVGLTGEALLDALWQKEHADTHEHDGDVAPNHTHDDVVADGEAVDGHRHGGPGGHWGTPTGACAAGTWSTLHPDCIGNTGCAVNPWAAPPCGCGCGMCWHDLCVDLACDITPGCPPIDDD